MAHECIKMVHICAVLVKSMFVLAIFLVGCQTTVSLDKAKEITASFEDTAFVAPPRTIKDITAILDQQKVADPEELARVVARADKKPPLAADAAVLASFYHERGNTAHILGREQQRLDDLRIALKYAEENGDINPRLYGDLSWAELWVNNIETAIRYAELRLTNEPNSSGAAANLVKVLARSGNIEEAHKKKQLFIQILNSPDHYHSQWDKINEVEIEEVLLQGTGRYPEIESFIRQGINLILDAGFHIEKPHLLDNRYGRLVRNLRDQSRFVEAEIVARNALLKAIEKGGKLSARVAGLVRDLANNLRHLGRYDDAKALLIVAVDIFEESGIPFDSFSLMATRFSLGMTLIAQEDWQGALKAFEMARRGNENTYDKKWGGRPYQALAILRTGKTTEAVAKLSKIYDQSVKRLGAKHDRTATREMILAVALASEGKKEEALIHFGKATPIVTSRSRQSNEELASDGENFRRLQIVMEPYIALLADIRGSDLESKLGINAISEAFRIANLVRSGSVQVALAASGSRSLAKNSDLSRLVRGEQDARKQISTNYAKLAGLLSAPTNQQNVKLVNFLQVRIDNLRDTRAVLMEEIETRFPDYAELLNPKPATIERTRASLRPGEAMISTYTTDKRTYVWVVPHIGDIEFTVAELGRDKLADRVKLLRLSLEPNAETLGDIPNFDVTSAYGLYEQLFKPVEAGWKNAKSLLIVAHNALGFLPLSVLPTESIELPAESGALFSNHRKVPWLARSHAVTMLPSVGSLVTLRSLPPGSPDRRYFAGFGDPLFNVQQAARADNSAKVTTQVSTVANRGELKTRGLPVRLRAAPRTGELDSAGLGQLPRLPDTADEVLSIASVLSANLTQDVFLGRRANEDVLKATDLSRYKVIIFATHGLVPGDLDGLTQPALALSTQKITGGKEDGLLTMGEIMGLKMDADWVVLSACNTGSANGAGAEAVSGLGQAFFYAGTRALLVSNWPVETSSAKTLTTDLFRRQANDTNLTRTNALHHAILAMINKGGYVDTKTGKMVFTYAHPIFWAPFSLIGDGGGGTPKI